MADKGGGIVHQELSKGIYQRQYFLLGRLKIE
jgi:hypothetical protein